MLVCVCADAGQAIIAIARTSRMFRAIRASKSHLLTTSTGSTDSEVLEMIQIPSDRRRSTFVRRPRHSSLRSAPFLEIGFDRRSRRLGHLVKPVWISPFKIVEDPCLSREVEAWIDPILEPIARNSFASNFRSKSELRSSFRVSAAMRRTTNPRSVCRKGSGAEVAPFTASSSLLAYRAANGDVNVPSTYSDKLLKNWVVVQRQFFKKGRLTANRMMLLNSINFSWSPFDEKWEQNLVRLKAFKKANGHANVPAKTADRKLATFIGELRSAKKAGKLSADRVKILENIGFDWDPLSTLWDAQYQRLVEFKKQHGHTIVSEALDLDLARWVYRQRSSKRLSADRIERLKKRLASTPT
jgi:hypothetical protein